MICCEKCFKDSEIKGIIKSLNNIGNCEICNNKNGYIYDTEINDNLVDNFNELLGVYTPENSLPEQFPKEKKSLLKDALNDKWNIFNVDSECIYSIVTNICKEKYEETPELFDSPTGILEINEKDYLVLNSVLKTHKWEEFVEEIKTKNRFHTKYINTEVLKVLCSYIEKPLKRGFKLFRARISEESGFPTGDMGPPPPGEASAGRVNPSGINYLYLADEPLTTVNEVRAGAYDYVSVGEFILKEDITIVDFTLLDKISPFTGLGNTTQLAINMDHLRKISNEIAKPLRRSDGPLDYLPTQYIADFIKSIKHDDGGTYAGIKYKSTLYEDGYNIAFFYKDLFECVEVCVYDVNRIDYRWKRIVE